MLLLFSRNLNDIRQKVSVNQQHHELQPPQSSHSLLHAGSAIVTVGFPFSCFFLSSCQHHRFPTQSFGFAANWLPLLSGWPIILQDAQ